MRTSFGGFPFLSHLKTIGPSVDPLELTFLAMIGLSCVGQLAAATEPGAIALLLPQAFRTVWLVILMLGCFVAFIGVLWPFDRIDSMLMEIIGLTWVFVALLIYGAAQIVAVFIMHAPLGSTLAGILVLLIGAGFGVKAMRLQRVIERLKKE